MDIKGNRFPVIVDEHCQSHIFHSRVIEADAEDYLTLGVRHFRVELFDEDADQSKALIQRFLRKISD
jgi:hypothetical protein